MPGNLRFSRRTVVTELQHDELSVFSQDDEVDSTDSDTFVSVLTFSSFDSKLDLACFFS